MLSLKPHAAFVEYMRFNDIYKAVFTAIFIVLSLYNFLLFITIKEVSYLYYAIMVMALGLHASLTFFFQYYSILLVGELSIIVASVIVFGGVKFNDRFLRCKKFLPKWHKIFKAIGYSALAVVFIEFLNMLVANNQLIDDYASILAAFLALMLVVLSLIAGILIYLQREKRGKHFLLINIPVFLGSMVYLFYWSGIHVFDTFEHSPYQVIIASFSFYGSVTIQVILLSIIVGYNIKGLEQEKLAIQRTINKQLSSQVEARTATLNQANREIEQQKEHLKEIIAVKDRLFSIISHDLRSPMNSLNGIIRLLKSKTLTPAEIDQLAHGLDQKLKGTSQLLDNLLYWSKNQMSGIHTRPELINMEQIIQKNIELMGNELIEKRISVNVQIKNGLEVYADLDMIDLVVRNVLSNAIKFSFDGGQIDIRSQPFNGWIQIQIRDYGQGIDDENLEKIFLADHNHSSIGTHNEKGTGLGLVLCKDFIERNSGMIQLESRIGEGTTVIFTLPSNKDQWVKI